jgi:adenine-specific DNA glycosylase
LLSERAGLQVKIGDLAGTFTATLTHRRIAYHVYEAETVRKRRKPPAYQQVRWVEPQTLESLPLSKTQQEILLTLLSR